MIFRCQATSTSLTSVSVRMFLSMGYIIVSVLKAYRRTCQPYSHLQKMNSYIGIKSTNQQTLIKDWADEIWRGSSKLQKLCNICNAKHFPFILNQITLGIAKAFKRIFGFSFLWRKRVNNLFKKIQIDLLTRIRRNKFASILETTMERSIRFRFSAGKQPIG